MTLPAPPPLQDMVALPAHRGAVSGVEFHYEDMFLAVCSTGGDLRLYQPKSWKLLTSLADRAPGAGHTCLSLGAYEPVLAAGCEGGAVVVWDVAAPPVAPAAVYAGTHVGTVTAIHCCPLRPGFVYSAGSDGRVVLRDRRQDQKSVVHVGAPLTALTAKEDNSWFGVATAGEHGGEQAQRQWEGGHRVGGGMLSRAVGGQCPAWKPAWKEGALPWLSPAHLILTLPAGPADWPYLALLTGHTWPC